MRRNFVSALAGLAAAIAAIGVMPAAALAQAPETVGIRILDAPDSRANDPRARLYIVDHLAPGTTINRRIEVSNDTSKAQTVQLYAAAADVVAGTFQFGEGRAANDLTRWTTVSPSSVSLAPKAKGVATVTIVVPAKATAGEQYGVVWAELNAPPPPGGGLGATNRVGVRMYLSVGPGGEPASDFEITTVVGQRATDGSPVVAATVRNTGGRALDLSGELRLANGPGGLSAGPFSATVGATLGVGQAAPVIITLDKALPSGPWDAKVQLRSGTTTRESGGSVTFPGEPAGAPAPVGAASGGGGRGVLIAGVIGLCVLVSIVLLVVLRGRRSRRDDEEAPAPATPSVV